MNIDFAFRWCLHVKFLRMTISVQFWKSNQQDLDHCANWKELYWKSMTQFRRYVKSNTKVVKTKIVASSIDLINDALKRVLLNTFSFYNFQLFENQLLNFSFSKTQPWNLELLTLFQISVRNLPENSTLADFLRCKTLLPPSFYFPTDFSRSWPKWFFVCIVFKSWTFTLQSKYLELSLFSF